MTNKRGDLGAFQAMLDAVMARPLGWGMDRPELAGEVDLVVVRQFLAVEHHDRVAVDRCLDGVAVAGLQRLREIDAGDLGKEAGRAWRNRDAQGSLLPL